MDFAPIFDAPAAVQAHVVCAAVALVLGPVPLWRRRRDRLHRASGHAWVAVMAALALSGLAIPAGPIALAGPFGPIHLLSVYVLWALWVGVGHARAGRIAAHRGAMRGLYFGAVGLAGLFTLLPGRLMNRVLFGDDSVLGLVVIGAGLAAMIGAWVAVRARAAARPQFSP